MSFHIFNGKFLGSRSHLARPLARLCPEFDFGLLLDKTEALAELSESPSRQAAQALFRDAPLLAAIQQAAASTVSQVAGGVP